MQMQTKANMHTNMKNEYADKHEDENEYEDDLSLEIIIPKPLTTDELKNIKNDIYISVDSNEENEFEESEENLYRISMEDNIHIYQGVKLYTCPRCYTFTTVSRSIMLGHLSRVTKCIENKDYNFETFNIEENIRQNNIKLYTCTKCNKITFTTPSKLKRHQYSLTPCTENFRCEYCDLDFRIENDLKAHQNRISCLKHTQKINNIYEIDIETNSEPKLDSNDIYKIYIVNGIEFYKCHLCQLLFKTKQNLNFHLNRKIKCNELHNCKKCNRKFHSIENLRKHEKNSKECDKNIFKCTNCNKHFNTNKSLNKHTKINNCIKDKY